MNIYKVLPELNNERQMRLWYQGLRSQWSAADMDWNAPRRILSDKLLDQLARVLDGVPPIIEALRGDLAGIGIDMEKVQYTLDRLAKQRLEKSIEGGKASAAKLAASSSEVETTASHPAAL